MKTTRPLLLSMALASLAMPVLGQPAAATRGGRYTIVVEGYDWGAGVSKVILATNKNVSSASAGDYTVSVKRRTDCGELPPQQAAGERIVTHAYASDAAG